jgi:hypothetical protein
LTTTFCVVHRSWTWSNACSFLNTSPTSDSLILAPEYSHLPSTRTSDYRRLARSSAPVRLSSPTRPRPSRHACATCQDGSTALILLDSLCGRVYGAASVGCCATGATPLPVSRCARATIDVLHVTLFGMPLLTVEKSVSSEYPAQRKSSCPCSQSDYPSARSLLVSRRAWGVFSHIPRHHHLLVHPRTRAYPRPSHTHFASFVLASKITAHPCSMTRSCAFAGTARSAVGAYSCCGSEAGRRRHGCARRRRRMSCNVSHSSRFTPQLRDDLPHANRLLASRLLLSLALHCSPSASSASASLAAPAISWLV